MKKTFDLWDGMIIAGAMAVVVGIWLLSPPVAVIVGGILLVTGGVLGAAEKGKRTSPLPSPRGEGGRERGN